MVLSEKGGFDKPGSDSELGHVEQSSATLQSRDNDGDSASDHHDAEMEEEIHELARRFTEEFNARKWAKAFYNIRENISGDAPPRMSGIAFRNLSVHGFGTPTDFQKTVGNVWLDAISMISCLRGKQAQRIDILRGLEGIVEAGEMLMVLGPPGSGCSTLLKTISGDTHGLYVDNDSTINYRGITAKQMRSVFRGEAIYTAEVDAHSPHMTVGDTLYFAARARCPQTIPDNVSRKEYAEHLRDVTMAMFGILHTTKTRVGDDFIRGVSGGERKRVTIAEAALSYSPL
ncbi:uncharacterized protein FTOL_02356 [Fusarium torulosum]|uniref:ABC transporter domain-containing protein n=1 Tax=Fusarium torulosum TaxID=33205 RepID=A0AAE8M1X4_9HYPO|nr:uncharacterized protein FTOL_02356 [Fusarium torulosum]